MPHHNTSSNDDHNTIPTQDDDAAGRNVSGFNISPYDFARIDSGEARPMVMELYDLEVSKLFDCIYVNLFPLNCLVLRQCKGPEAL